MLIVGCSHAAGSEIDGSPDSQYNRDHSFGNVLAKKMGYRPINIASPASANATIARSVIEWFDSQYKPEEHEVFVLVAWSEPSRMEAPYQRAFWYERSNPFGDWYSPSGRDYLRINAGYAGWDPAEKPLIAEYQRFMVSGEGYLEIQSANFALQLTYLFKLLKVDYLMCNMMRLYSGIHQADFYTDRLDKTKYFGMKDPSEAFFLKYQAEGYKNPKAKYWHHSETPHRLYADRLYSFIESNKCS